MAQQDRGVCESVSVATRVRERVRSLLRVGDLPDHVDAGIRTKRLTVEVSLCEFRESLRPAVFADEKSMDLFVPLPGERALWIALCSWWLSERLGNEPRLGSDLAEIVPEPPHECVADGCEYKTENYGMFLLHDQREHYPTVDGKVPVERGDATGGEGR